MEVIDTESRQRRIFSQSKEQAQPVTLDQDVSTEATALEIEDDVSLTGSVESSRSSASEISAKLNHSPDPVGILTIRMHSDRISTGLDADAKRHNDAIAWSAHVYDAKRERRGRSRSPLDVDVRYVDHKPLCFAKRREATSSQDDRDGGTTDPSDEQKPERWRGPVIEILVHVRAGISDRFAPPPGYEDEAFSIRRDASMSPPPQTIRGPRRVPYRSSSLEPMKWRAKATNTLPVRVEALPIDRWSLESLVIRSPYLADAICARVGLTKEEIPQTDSLFYPSSWTSLLIFEEPYRFLLQNFTKLASVKDSDGSVSMQPDQNVDNRPSTLTKLQRQHLMILVDFLQPLYESLVGPCLRQLSLSTPQVEFNLLWYILRPFTKVYIRDDSGAIQICVVGSFESPDAQSHPIKRSQRRRQKTPLWEVDLFILVTDGAKIGWQRVVRDIHFFSGLKDVVALDIVPVEIWDATDGGKRRQEILKRGDLMEKILRQGFQMVEHVPPRDSTNYKFSGKVVVDHRRGRNARNAAPVAFDVLPSLDVHYPNCSNIYVNTYQKAEEVLEYAPGVDARGRSDTRYRPIEVIPPANTSRRYRRPVYDDDESPDRYGTTSHDQRISPALTEDQLLLLQPRLMAFGLKTKHWMSVDTGHLKEIQASTESIENLIIEPQELELIRALSKDMDSSADSWGADFIEGKGSGKIILLHGPPGVGKTYTVESIAQWLDCPLLALTVADIGTIETRIEGELLKWFSLAEAWNAVLLVDEADIFLERRQTRDLARNGLVSAFLRRMEYFRGLLFLTTNRVGQIDDAFISRVHVAIEYKHLSPLYTRRIWEGFFRKLAKDRAGKIQVASNAKKWVLEKFEKEPNALNGRDIRNALQTAITLAQFESSEDPDFDPKTMVVVVGKDHFERVLEMSNNFQDYVTSIRREDERQRASGRLDRNDFRNDAPQAMSATLAQQYLIPRSKQGGI